MCVCACKSLVLSRQVSFPASHVPVASPSLPLPFPLSHVPFVLFLISPPLHDLLLFSLPCPLTRFPYVPRAYIYILWYRICPSLLEAVRMQITCNVGKSRSLEVACPLFLKKTSFRHVCGVFVVRLRTSPLVSGVYVSVDAAFLSQCAMNGGEVLWRIGKKFRKKFAENLRERNKSVTFATLKCAKNTVLSVFIPRA